MVFLYQKQLSRFFPKSSSKVDIKTQITKYSYLSVLQKPILLLPGLWNSLSQLKCRGSLETKERFLFFFLIVIIKPLKHNHVKSVCQIVPTSAAQMTQISFR